MRTRPVPPYRWAVATLIATALAVGACADGAQDQTGSAPPVTHSTTPGEPAAPAGTPGASGTTAAPANVPDALRFTARTVDGQEFDAATLAGEPVVLWFWAAWCTRCRAAAGNVATVQRDNADRVNLVGVAGLGSGTDAMRTFISQQGIGGFPNLADDDGSVWRKFKVTSQEQYVLIDRAGKVVHTGPLSADELRQRVAALG